MYVYLVWKHDKHTGNKMLLDIFSTPERAYESYKEIANNNYIIYSIETKKVKD